MIEWISVKDKLPEKSAQVLTLSPAGVISTTDYSAKWESFNAHDFMNKKTIEQYNINKYVAYWLPISVLPKPPKESEAE